MTPQKETTLTNEEIAKNIFNKIKYWWESRGYIDSSIMFIREALSAKDSIINELKVENKSIKESLDAKDKIIADLQGKLERAWQKLYEKILSEHGHATLTPAGLNLLEVAEEKIESLEEKLKEAENDVRRLALETQKWAGDYNSLTLRLRQMEEALKDIADGNYPGSIQTLMKKGVLDIKTEILSWSQKRAREALNPKEIR